MGDGLRFTRPGDVRGRSVIWARSGIMDRSGGMGKGGRKSSSGGGKGSRIFQRVWLPSIFSTSDAFLTISKRSGVREYAVRTVIWT